jgi:predicted glycosyl hydrolase (DUF1957 family)
VCLATSLSLAELVVYAFEWYHYTSLFGEFWLAGSHLLANLLELVTAIELCIVTLTARSIQRIFT